MKIPGERSTVASTVAMAGALIVSFLGFILIGFFTNINVQLNSWEVGLMFFNTLGGAAFFVGIQAMLDAKTRKICTPLGTARMVDTAPIEIAVSYFPVERPQFDKYYQMSHPQADAISNADLGKDSQKRAVSMKYLILGGYEGFGLKFPGKDGFILFFGDEDIIKMGETETGGEYVWTPRIPRLLSHEEIPGDVIDALLLTHRYVPYKTPVFLLADMSTAFTNYIVSNKSWVIKIAEAGPDSMKGVQDEKLFRGLWLSAEKKAANYRAQLDAEQSKNRMDTETMLGTSVRRYKAGKRRGRLDAPHIEEAVDRSEAAVSEEL